MLNIIALILIAYIIGNIQIAFLIGRLYGKDLRKTGSKNAGASNVFKSIGKLQGVIVTIVDTAIGFMIVYLARDYSLLGIYLVGLAIVSGHNWPFVLRFKGGQGLAITAGLVIASITLLTGLDKMIAILFMLNFIIMRYLLILPYRK